MKLSILIENLSGGDISELLETLKKQKTDDVELLLLCDKAGKKTTEYTTVNCKDMTVEEALKHGRTKAKGEYTAVILSGDTVTDEYIPEILNATNDKPDIIFLKWQYINWYDMCFVGKGNYFSDVIRNEQGCGTAKIDKIIYYHKKR